MVSVYECRAMRLIPKGQGDERLWTFVFAGRRVGLHPIAPRKVTVHPQIPTRNLPSEILYLVRRNHVEVTGNLKAGDHRSSQLLSADRTELHRSGSQHPFRLRVALHKLRFTNSVFDDL